MSTDQLQKTVRDCFTLEGIGLHSGQKTRVHVKPAPPHTGLIFVRIDRHRGSQASTDIPAHLSNITSTHLATTLSKGSESISTVEHLLSALAGKNIHNARIEVDGPEIPILDGSCREFASAIDAVGVDEMIAPVSRIRIKKRVEVRHQEKWAYVEPFMGYRIHASIEWDHPEIGYQEYCYTEGKSSFTKEIAPARTFGFVEDVERLQALGLIKGGSMECAVVLSDHGVMNPEGLRFSEEFVRHKILDALGDFCALGVKLEGSLRLHRSGHEVHRLLMEAILSEPENYEIIAGDLKERTLKDRSKEFNSVPISAASLALAT